MKKLILACGFMFACAVVTRAQNPVPNPGFEEWISYGTYEDPDGWGTKNEDTWTFGISVKKDNSSHSDQYAAKILTIGHGNDIYPGVACTGAVLFSNSSCKGGFPVSSGYESFTGWLKYAPIEIDSSGTPDSCLLFAMLTKWNGNGRDTVAVAKLLFGDSIPNYTQFSKNFNYLLAENPDSGQIVFISTSNIINPVVGSILVVDDVAFSGIVGVSEISPAPVKVFPNPVNDVLQLRMPDALHAVAMELYDFTGIRRLYTALNNNQELPTDNFSEGIFCYRILNEHHEVIATGKLMVKH